jgi:hypothetical protein
MLCFWGEKRNISTNRSKKALKRISMIFLKKLLFGRVSILEFMSCFILDFFIINLSPLRVCNGRHELKRRERELGEAAHSNNIQHA